MSNSRFTPVRGSESSITSYPYSDGYTYYATDTGKIYLDANGERIPMGGAGAAIYYADASGVQENDETYYPIPKDSLDNEDAVLKEGDLIINSDGAFYKVATIEAEEYLCERIAVSGTGGGDNPEGIKKRTSITIHPLETSNLINGQSAIVSFTATSAIDVDGAEMDDELKIVWTLYEKVGNSEVKYQGNIIENVPSGEKYSFDFGKYLRESTTTIIELVPEGVNGGIGPKRRTTVVTSSLVLQQTSTFSNATTYTPNNVVLQCNAIGSMEKILKFWFDGQLLETRTLGPGADNLQTLNIDSNLAGHGYHSVKIELFQSINGKEGLPVAPLEYELAVVGNSDKPIVWLGNYQKIYYNYDSIQIPFLVYDPENTTEAIVHLYKNAIELNSSPRTIKDFSAFNIFEIADADLGLINYYQISCGEGDRKVEREISFSVEQDPNRKMEVVKSDYLKLNFEAKGRSNSESVTNRQKWENEDGSIKATFENFNWYNNGWLMDDDNNAYLRISNGASFKLPIGPMIFASNKSSEQSNSIEFQFKVKNIQDYSNLIKNVTRYKEDEAFYAEFKKQSKYTNYDAFLQWYLNNTPEAGKKYDDLEFDKVQKEISLDKTVCSYYSGDESSVVGLCLGPQDAFFSNGVNTVNVSYVEDDMINLSMVYYHALKLMYIYINGIVTGVIKSTLSDPFEINANEMIFNSEYCDIDLYKVRVYNTDLNVNDIVTNYAVDFKNVTIYDQNKLAEENNAIKEYQFIYKNMISYNEAHPDAPLMPYIVFDTSKSGTDILPWSKAVSIPVSVTFVNTGLEKAYASGELEALAIEDGLCTINSTPEQKAAAVKTYYKHHCPSWTGDNIEMVVQGTSSEFYPRRNYKIKTKTEYDSDEKERIHIFLNKGPYEQEYIEDQNNIAEGSIKLGDEKTRQDFWYMNNYTNGTHKWTMKVDYMESSGSYNAGFAGMVGNAYSKHPLKDYIDKGVIDPMDKDDDGNLIPNGDNLLYSEVTNSMNWQDYRTSLLGFPVLAFHKKSDGSYLFIGTYRMLLDKGSDEVLGFKPNKKVTQKLLGNKAVRKKAECWEFCNNARGFCSYRDPWNRVELSFEAPESAIQDGTGLTAKGAPIITDHIEYRYNDNEDFIDILLDMEGITSEENEEIKKEFGDEYDVLADPKKGYELIFDFYKNWEKVNKWVWSTCLENVVSQGNYIRVYTGINIYEPNKYYVMNDEGSAYIICEDAEWTPGKIYFEREQMKDSENKPVFETDENGDPILDDNGEKIPVYNYTNAYVTSEEYKYERNKFYEKIGENDFVLSAEPFDTSVEYYRLDETDAYKSQADVLVKVCNEETYDPNKTYYNYDGSVEVGTKATTVVDSVTAEANYAPGKYYIENPVTYGKRTYTHDTKEYRSDKFVNELSKHFDTEYLATYFIMTEVFECYDSRGKNCMMASWGPLEEGGDYVWYPIFYDIDTQLGINNTGIPSFEFNVDATEAGNYSTSDSILWNNFYRFFKKSYILMKYKHLKGITDGVNWNKLSNPPLSSVQDIENWYRFDPVETNSIMARGERPLIAINLDEYFKYITITNSLGKDSGITGYLDRGGKYTHDSNGTYFYALQGDRSQSRRQFLTNRLEYIDSWLNQGNYQRGGVNCIRGRVAANNPTKTSDKWTETNNDTSATGGSYYLEDGTKRNEFDAQYWLDLTPIRSSYITVSDDSAAYPSEKYDGINPVKFNVTAIENGVRKSPNYPEQLLYIYGMNQMADVGDLSNLYWQEFYIDGEAPKLTRLKIGHDGLDKDNNRWYNNKMNLPSIPASKESTGMPLLKEVNFCNITISTGSPSLDLTSCEKLEDFRATGSNFADVLFAEGVALNTLYLPSSITRLALTEANLLKNVITAYETPVEVDGKLTAKPGLYIDGLFNADSNLDLHTINLVGGALGYDSYKLLAKFYEKKKTAEIDKKITMTNVNWCPYTQLVEGDNYDLAHPELYFIDNGHYGFERYEYDVDKFNIQVLSGEIYKKENIAEEIINQIDDSGLDMLKVFMNNDKFKSAAGTKVPNITGIIYINNATQIDEGYIRNTLQEAYPGLKFFFADVNPAYSAKFVLVDEETGAYNYVPFADGSTSMPSVQKISKQEYADGKTWFDNPYTLYHKEFKTHYDFKGWSTSTSKEDIITEINWNNNAINPDQIDYTFYAIFEIHAYDFIFMNDEDGSGENFKELGRIKVPYGSPVNMIELNKLFPWKDDSALDLTSTYKFTGYSVTPAGNIVNMETYISRKEQTFYAQYEEDSVYNNILNPSYLKITANGALSVDKDNYIDENNEISVLKGKITLPNKINGINVKSISNKGFEDAVNITHIFWENKDTCSLTLIGETAFGDCKKLKYFEMPILTETLSSSAFNGCSQLFNDVEQKDIDQFFEPLLYINTLALLNVPFGGMTVNISDKTQRIEAQAFAQTKMAEVNIGSSGHPSELNSAGQRMFRTSSVSKITIYTDDISKAIWTTFQSNVGNEAEVQILNA